MIVHFAGRAFFVAVSMIVPRENSVPSTVFVVNEVFPTVRPDTLIPIPIMCVSGVRTDQCRGSKRRT